MNSNTHKKEGTQNPSSFSNYGKKRYCLHPLIARVKEEPRNLPDYRDEEYTCELEFD
jgi:hypothetical protein